jgi:hypothetical protein
MDPSQVDLIAVLVAGSVGFAVGGLWYAPFAFGPLWLRYTTVSAEDLAANIGLGPSLVALGGVLVQAGVLALMLVATDTHGVAPALALALVLWVGLTAAPAFVDTLEARRPLIGWAVDAGHRLVALAAMALVLAVWP